LKQRLGQEELRFASAKPGRSQLKEWDFTTMSATEQTIADGSTYLRLGSRGAPSERAL
jgi:hypothetical protein